MTPSRQERDLPTSSSISSSSPTTTLLSDSETRAREDLSGIEINCMNDSRDFQDSESVRSGQSHVASQPVYVFANPTASSSAPYPQELNPWSSDVSEHTSPHVVTESQTPVQDQRCQSGPSARNSVIPSEGGFSQNHGADQRLQISDLHF